MMFYKKNKNWRVTKKSVISGWHLRIAMIFPLFPRLHPFFFHSCRFLSHLVKYTWVPAMMLPIKIKVIFLHHCNIPSNNNGTISHNLWSIEKKANDGNGDVKREKKGTYIFIKLLLNEKKKVLKADDFPLCLHFFFLSFSSKLSNKKCKCDFRFMLFVEKLTDNSVFFLFSLLFV